MVSSRTILSCALMGTLTFTLGCASFWHELKPHRLHKWNRGPAPSLDPEFSVRKRERSIRLVKQDAASKNPTLSVNSAEIAVVRAQTPAGETTLR
jgi:hypothetical protein